MELVTDTVLPYLAGFVDGEGSISTSRWQNHAVTLRFDVMQNDQRPLLILQQLFGGHIRKHNKRHPKTGNQCWVWTVINGKAKAALVRLSPFLVVKANQAAIASLFPTDDPRRHPLIGILRDEVRRALHEVNGYSAAWRGQ